MDAIAAEVCRIVAETQDVPGGAVRPEMALEADLGVDSLGMIEITVALEEALGFRAPEVDHVGELSIVTVGDLIEFVAGQVGRQPEPAP